MVCPKRFYGVTSHPILLSTTGYLVRGLNVAFSKRCVCNHTLCFFFVSESNITEAWIGLHDSLTEGRYVWVDGSPIPFSEWLPEEPDGNEAENCIVQAKGKFGAGWADKHCFDSKAFVCEVPLPGK